MAAFPRIGSILVALLWISIIVQPAMAQSPAEYSDFNELDLEDLLNQTVVSASKYEQKLNEIPVAATVITHEEIAASGARTIPEVLDEVPGLDIIQTTSSAFAVSARGLNKPGSNNMLVLVDGRSVYLDFYGLTIWDNLSVSLEDIKSIEVILGPGSAMYGANAFAGIINIITFSPGEKPGQSARTMVTSLGESYASARVARVHGQTSYKINGSWDSSSDWETKEPEAEVSRFSGQLEHKMSDVTRFGFSAGHVNGVSRILPYDASLLADGQNSFLRADGQHAGFDLRYFMNSWDYGMVPQTTELSEVAVNLSILMHDLELQHQFRFNEEHRFLWGGSYRHRQTEYSGPGETLEEDIFAAFVLEEWQPNNKFFISAGLRYEHHPLVKGHVSPRGGLVYKIHPQHSLRASYSRAYRNPSFLETYWSTTYDIAPGMSQTIRGDVENRSESIEAFEFGYQGMAKKDLLVKAAIFHNNVDDLIQVVSMSFFPVPYETLPDEMALVNNDSWQARGGELSFQGTPRPWLKLNGSYSYVRVENSDTGVHQPQAPAHTGHLAATWIHSPGNQLKLNGRYRSETRWYNGSPLASDILVAPEWVLWDLSWNYQLPTGGRLTLGLENIFDKRIRHYPAAIEQHRRAKMSLNLEF